MTSRYVEPSRARAHVIELLETLTVGQIEQRSGVHRTVIRSLVGDIPGRPQASRIAARSEAAILAVDNRAVGTETSGLVNAAGSRRRLRALVALGHPRRFLAGQLDVSVRAVRMLVDRDDQAFVRAATRAAVIALYDELSMTIPPTSRESLAARTFAAEHGWVPPLAWDDETIDDPEAETDRGFGGEHETEDDVDEIAVERAIAGDQPGGLRPAERRAIVKTLNERGVSDTEIERRTGISSRTVSRIREELALASVEPRRLHGSARRAVRVDRRTATG